MFGRGRWGDGKGGDEMGEKEKGKGDEGGKDEGGRLADGAVREASWKAGDVKKRAMGWLLATKNADRLDTALRGARKAHDDAEAEATKLGEELIAVLNTHDRIRTHRVFLPGDANVDATLVEVTTGSAKPSVRAYPVDFVAGS